MHFTVVEYRFQPGAVFPIHHHPEEQVVIVLAGSVRFAVDGQPADLGPGDCARVAPHVPHGATAGPDGARMLNLVSPRRDAVIPQAPRDKAGGGAGISMSLK